jgi:hypothetical protein
VYAYLAAATGWTWEYIGEFLTLPRLRAMMQHYDRHPPTHIATAAAWLERKPSIDEQKLQQEAEIMSLPVRPKRIAGRG